jgi:DNA-binding NtrC family response regulator
MQRVLIIEDNPDVQKALSLLLELHEIDSTTALDPAAGLVMLAREPVDLVIQDMNFSEDNTSGKEGRELFKQIRTRDPDLPIVLLTAWADLETAVDLVRAGAADYMSKPWDDLKLITSIKNLLELRELQRKSRSARRSRMAEIRRLEKEFDLCGAVFESDAMIQVMNLATQVARADVPILITGPNGTGKDVVAQVIRANSAVKDGPFVTVNVGALPNELMEAELFGAEAGAFTGATKGRKGRFESADNGTLFLDEIGNLSASGQMKLLRVLQTGEFERLGSSQTRKVNVRVISATNTDLHTAIGNGEFREDLFYRLNVIEIRLPPLAGRKDDVLPLASHFLDDHHRLDASAELTLLSYNWPGNVRELQNTLQRAQLLKSGRRITAADLGLPVIERGAGSDDREDGLEPGEEEIQRALVRADGNVSQAARELGLSRQAVYRRVEKFESDS